MRNQFPIYIPSKSRWESRLTVKNLEKIKAEYYVIVEEPQLEQYASVIPRHRLLVLDPYYQQIYDTFDDLGFSKSLGPGPARNMAWQHAVDNGFAWHWVMDDNIDGFYWRHNNHKIKAGDTTPLACMENFVLQYKNIGMAGPNYFLSAPCRANMKPFSLNTHIYSCNLIRNSIPIRWRGRYNEDTDISIMMLKAGWNTVQFNAFLQLKTPTQLMKGGNTEAFYAAEGTYAKSQMLYRMHPDIVRLKWRFGRAHHLVDYSRWKNVPLIPDPNAPKPLSVSAKVQSKNG